MPAPAIVSRVRITEARWAATRQALAETTDRLAAVVAASDPGAMATRDWTVADTLAHVTAIAAGFTAHVRSPEPDEADEAPVTVDMVAGMNARLLAMETERDPAILLDRLRGAVDEIVRASEDLDPDAPLAWLGGSRVPRAGVLAHLVNELQVHGRDIARATRSPWPIPPADAALFFDLFLVGMMRHDVGHLLDTDEPPRERRIAVAFRSRHTTPVTLVLHRGKVSVEEPGGPTDVRLSFDPRTLNLVLFHRIGWPSAALTGKVRIGGRRPWLLPTFLRTVRLP